MYFNVITSKSVEIIGKCLEQCLCTRQYSYVAELFEYISPLDRNFCMSPCIDKKIVEERFLASLTLATITDDCNTFVEQLKDTLKEAEEHEKAIREVGGEWIQSYACDNPACFRDYNEYLEQAGKFAVVEKKFFRKFSNTRKHGKKMWDADGKPIYHNLHTYSPICNDNYTKSLFTLNQCGGKGLNQVFKLFEEIIAVFVRTYRYAQGVDIYAQSMRFNAIGARMILTNSIKKELSAFHIDNITNIEDHLVNYAKQQIDKEMLDHIYNKTIMELAPAFYHLVTTGEFPWMAILIKDKENHQGILSEIESDIFKGIKDPKQRVQTVLEIRKLIYNFDSFTGITYERGENNKKDKILNVGDVLAFIVEYINEKVKLDYSIKKFITNYFCKLRNIEADGETLYKKFNYARNHMNLHDLKRKAFDNKKQEILRNTQKYSEIN